MNFEIARKKMVSEQIVSRGIKDARVLEAILAIPRHIFVQEAMAAQAYSDTPLPIGEKQTISQPYMVALMTELLQLSGREKVLEIGTGSGYQTAILARLADQVCSIERIRSLAVQARKCLDSLGYFNVRLLMNDSQDSPVGWPEEAPFDAVLVTAGAPKIPGVLLEQLAPGGKLVIPVGNNSDQKLLRVVKFEDGTYQTEATVDCRFVPLVGRDGWMAMQGL